MTRQRVLNFLKWQYLLGMKVGSSSPPHARTGTPTPLKSKPMNADDIAALQPAEAWFAGRGWQPFPFQREVWQAYLNGESGLVHAATGTGKTYSVWLGPLLEWRAQHPPGMALKKRKDAPLLTVLWITPLRALVSDTAESLSAPLRELDIPWTLETRTGDTDSAARSRQRTQLPTVLITTPESLSLLLARDNAAELFRHLRMVVVDEWHELMASKRGVQVELGLARLRRWHPGLRTWGLSATLGNLDSALHTLMGEARPGRLVRGLLPKALQVESVIPQSLERFPWAGHLGLRLLPDVLHVVESGRSALVFTNTRSQTEAWYQAILEARPEWAGEIALHHGSLDKGVREWVEDGLRDGRLRCVVCTSSLDLGVDFAPVDNVLQIGSPKGVGRLLQRAGRSGHRPGAESRVVCVPAHAFELIEIAAARDAILSGHIESRPPVERPLDVLVQHLVTVGLGGGFTVDELLDEVRTTHAYRDLSQEEFGWVLDFVTHGGEALRAYPEYARVTKRDGHYVVENRLAAQIHRMSIGTIVSDSSLRVQYVGGSQIGFIEESFAARLKPGDKFTLGGKVLSFVRLREMTVFVEAARSKKGLIPRWYGGGFPLSDTLTEHVRAKLDDARDGLYESAEMVALRPILELQAKWSLIPRRDELLIERLKTRDGHHLFLYPFEGHLVHEGLAALLAYRLSRLQPITFTISLTDYGIELLSPEPAPLEEALANGLLSAKNLAEDIAHSLNAAEMAKRQFREIARVAGLVIQRFPGGQKTNRSLQATSGLLYEVFARYDADNLLLRQAQREVLERQLEDTRLTSALNRLANGTITMVDVPRPTPFAFLLLVERERQTVSSERLSDRVRKMVLQLEEAAESPFKEVKSRK